jgi:hypothetical protein
MREKVWLPSTNQAPGMRRVADAMRAVSKELPEFDDDDMPEVATWALNRSRPEGGGGRPTL